MLVFVFTIIRTVFYAKLDARIREKEQQDMLKWQIPDDSVENAIKDYPGTIEFE